VLDAPHKTRTYKHPIRRVKCRRNCGRVLLEPVFLGNGPGPAEIPPDSPVRVRALVGFKVHNSGYRHARRASDATHSESYPPAATICANGKLLESECSLGAPRLTRRSLLTAGTHRPSSSKQLNRSIPRVAGRRIARGHPLRSS